MFKKVFEYAGPHKKDLYIATFIVLLSVLMGVLPFVLAYQVISPLVMGNAVDTKYVCIRVIGVLICLILQAILYGWGLDVSHKAAYSTLLRLRTSLQKRFEAVPLGFIQDKGTGTIKKLFVDDVDSLEVLLAHSLPEGIANLMIPIAIYNETCSRPPTDLRGNPAVCASPLRQRYRGVMTALPRAACIVPTIRGAWQIGWIFSNGQAERLRRYSPLCYVAPILPAQPPLKVRYHALTGFPVSVFM